VRERQTSALRKEGPKKRNMEVGQQSARVGRGGRRSQRKRKRKRPLDAGGWDNTRGSRGGKIGGACLPWVGKKKKRGETSLWGGWRHGRENAKNSGLKGGGGNEERKEIDTLSKTPEETRKDAQDTGGYQLTRVRKKSIPRKMGKKGGEKKGRGINLSGCLTGKGDD